MFYTCTICGKQFEAKHKSAACPECKQGVCVICGAKFTRISPYTQKTCSSKCRGIYRAQSGIGKQVGAKMKETKMKRYSSLDPTIVTEKKNKKKIAKKICPLCNREFQPDTTRQVYCKNIHYGPCPVCGKQTPIKEIYLGPQACSEKCRMARINQTCLERYGNKDAVNSTHAKMLAKTHNLEKYGVEYPMQNEEIKNRAKATTLERYGVENAMQNKDIQNKAMQTNLERYGVEYALQSDEIKSKVHATMIEKYGGTGLGSQELRKKITATNKEKYGVEYVVQSAEFAQKARQTMLDKYGYENYQQSLEGKRHSMKDPSKAEEWIKFINDPASYITTHYSSKPTIYVLCNDLGVTDTPIYDVLVETKSSHLINHTKQSTMEYQVIEFLKQHLDEQDIVLNTRRIIKPEEIDIYLPQYNVGIECNPTVTHNSSLPDPWGQGPKSPSYHKHKTDKAEKAGIFIYHIFGYEWTKDKYIIQSMISNLLGFTIDKIYARNTTIKEVPYEQAQQFLDSNHRQGRLSANFYCGLYTKDDKLVSLMSFNKMRPGMGKTVDDNEGTYELSRFCNLLNTTVVGGASKLLKHFITEHNPKKIVSFSDRAHTRGNLYETLGFHKVNISEPGYVWVNLADDSYYHRTTCQKSNLRKLFKDDSIDIENRTEREIMIEHGYVQVYDSGVIRWELNL